MEPNHGNDWLRAFALGLATANSKLCGNVLGLYPKMFSDPERKLLTALACTDSRIAGDLRKDALLALAIQDVGGIAVSVLARLRAQGDLMCQKEFAALVKLQAERLPPAEFRRWLQQASEPFAEDTPSTPPATLPMQQKEKVG